MLDQLENYTDDQLMALITQAHKVLDQRDRERRNEAAKQIRQLAAEVGLSVEIKGANPASEVCARRFRSKVCSNTLYQSK
jgi:hypothetical protein